MAMAPTYRLRSCEADDVAAVAGVDAKQRLTEPCLYACVYVYAYNDTQPKQAQTAKK